MNAAPRGAEGNLERLNRIARPADRGWKSALRHEPIPVAGISASSGCRAQARAGIGCGGWGRFEGAVDGLPHLIEPPSGAGQAAAATGGETDGGKAVQAHFQLLSLHGFSFFQYYLSRPD